MTKWAYMGAAAVAIFFVGAVVFRALALRGYDPIDTVARVFGPMEAAPVVPTTPV